MILDNPLFRREALRMRREWMPWSAVTLLAIAIEAFVRSRLYFQMFPIGRAWTHFAQVFTLAIRVPALAALYFIFGIVTRENRSGGWDQLALTRMSPREIFTGLAALPFLYITALSVLLIPFSYYLAMLNFGISPSDIWRSLAIALPFGLVEDVMYALAVCMISLYFAINFPLIQASVNTLLVLCGLGLWMMVCSQFAEYLALSMTGLTGAPSSLTLEAAFHAVFAAPVCSAEAWIAWRAGKAVLQGLKDRVNIA